MENYEHLNSWKEGWNFEKTQFLIIFENSNDHNFLSEQNRKTEFRALKRAHFCPRITSIQLMCHEYRILNNLTKTKMIKIKGFSACFSHYFINCLLPCAASTKTNYSIVILIKFSFSSNKFQTFIFFGSQAALVWKIYTKLEEKIPNTVDQPLQLRDWANVHT